MKRPSRSSRRKSVLLTSAATGAAATLAPAIMAAPIVVIPAIPPTASVTSTGADGDFVDLNNDGTKDFAFAIYRQFGGSSFAGVAILAGLPRGSGPLASNNRFQTFQTSYPVVDRQVKGISFQVGTSFIGGTQALLRGVTQSSTGPVYTFGIWPGGAAFGDSFGYVAVEFAANDGLHYGWIKLSVRNDVDSIPDGVQAIAWAYESEPGVPLHVTSLAVPEVPVSAAGLGALALGAAGIQALRRKRAQTRPQARP